MLQGKHNFSFVLGETAGSPGKLMLNFIRNCKLFMKVAVPSAFPPAPWEFQLYHIFPSVSFPVCLHFNHSGGCTEVGISLPF